MDDHRVAPASARPLGGLGVLLIAATPSAEQGQLRGPIPVPLRGVAPVVRTLHVGVLMQATSGQRNYVVNAWRLRVPRIDIAADVITTELTAPAISLEDHSRVYVLHERGALPCPPTLGVHLPLVGVPAVIGGAILHATPSKEDTHARCVS